MSCSMDLPDAIDLSHHLSKVSRAREISPLKDLQKYLGRDDMIMLAGGLPHPDLFPFEGISARAYSQDVFPTTTSKLSLFSWFTKLFSRSKKGTWAKLEIPRYPQQPADLNLAQLLQYGLAQGQPLLQDIMKEIVEKVYKPGYGNWKILMNAGNSDGWAKVVMTLCDPGDAIITEEWTYPSALATAKPLGFKPVPVEMDEEGMRSDALFRLLATWDEHVRGAPRPRVMYTVPIGQNPTGATMHLERKKEIYKICVQFDVIIVEDDPYYFLQEGPYVPKKDRSMQSKEVSNEAFLASLAPSYLRIDRQGRVVRLDTFSKTIAPGCRLGWFTCNPLFAERLERASETSSQAPSGFSQGLVIALLVKWKFDGYVRWLKGLRAQYQQRRNLCIDSFEESFDLNLQSSGSDRTIYDGYVKSKTGHSPNHWSEKFVHTDKRFPVISFVVPTSGMFVWLQINFRNHQSFSRLGYKDLERRLFTEFAEAGVLVGPGSIFSPTQVDQDGPGHVRLSFSNADPADLRRAIGIMATVLERFFFGGDQS